MTMQRCALLLAGAAAALPTRERAQALGSGDHVPDPTAAPG